MEREGNSIAGYILTGGKNRRMGGKRKLFLEYKGKPFYWHILQALDLFSNVYLSVDAIPPYEVLSLPMIVDQYPEIGPIGGIYSGLQYCREEALFVTACDMPLIDQNVVRQVIEQYEKENNITVVQVKEQIHPLFGIYPKTVLPIIEQMIQANDYRIMNLLALAQVSVVQLDNNSRIAENINTEKEYERLRGETNGTEIESF